MKSNWNGMTGMGWMMGRLFAVVAALGVAAAGAAADWTLATVEKPVPEAVAGDIAALMQPMAIQLSQGDKTLYEFWLPKAISLKAKPSSASDALREVGVTTLLGVAKVHKDLRDYRDDDLYSGLHTMRFALKPEDGNHLGTSEYPFFAVLVAAERDRSVDGISTYKELTNRSSEDTASEHPMILSMRPPVSGDGPFPSIQEPAHEHHSLHLKVPATAADSGEACEMIFELVFEGIGEI